ncbi:PBP1A family penicillin-binding protein [candidate division WOR-3 bacterium]|nr:PBP1A family penicillin-binding protein [candidate division WOR-3 bacterium]MCK4527662.1 PBP1A family penicillin-binding protein [candidate division WOR-3 bacterium]
MIRRLLICSVLFFILGGLAGINVWILNDIPGVESIEYYEPLLTTRIYDRNNELIDEVYQQRRIPLRLDSIPDYISNAAIAVEDKEFYNHPGINLRRMAKVIWVNLIRRSFVQGASTITQQLSRNIFLHLKKKMIRKIKEIYLALLIERHYSKDKILEMYLNEIYIGYGNYGIGAASEYYFDKELDSVSLSEAAALIGLIASPGRYSPYNSYEKFIKRRNFVLKELNREGYIGVEDLDSALSESLSVVDHSSKNKIGPYYINEVKKQMNSIFGSAYRTWGGYKVYTTMDKNMQILADSLTEWGLSRVEKHWHLTPKDSIPDSLIHSENIPYIQGAIVVMEPKTGYVLSLVGGRDFKHSLFNRATQAKRQAGSAFKPFLYTAAIDNGFSPSDFVFDLPIVKEVAGQTYAPGNYDSTFMGKITLRKALSKSRNGAAVRLGQEVGPFTVVDYAHQMGIESYLDPVISIPLGTSGVTPLEMVRGYATLANLGEKIEPIFIKKVEDRYGNIVYESRVVNKRVLSKGISYIMVSMLQSVFDEGTAYGARRQGFKLTAAGKTGTTDNFTDGWFIGFTPDLVVGVWVGYDYPKRIGNHASGAGIALPIWTKFMKAVVDSTKDCQFPEPDNIVFRYVCTESGQLATPQCPKVKREVFIRGNEPKRRCSLHGKGEETKEKSIEMIDKFHF